MTDNAGRIVISKGLGLVVTLGWAVILAIVLPAERKQSDGIEALEKGAVRTETQLDQVINSTNGLTLRLDAMADRTNGQQTDLARHEDRLARIEEIIVRSRSPSPPD